MSVIFIVNLLAASSVPLASGHDWSQVVRVGSATSGRTRVSIAGVAAEVGDDTLVELLPGADVNDLCARAGAVAVRQLLPTRPLWLVRDAARRRDGLALAIAMSGLAGLRYADPNFYFHRTLMNMPVPPNDPKYPSQWYLRNIGIERAWHHNTGSDAVTVQVIDNGCDMTHPDLAGHLLQGRDVIDQDDDPSAVETGSAANHGTSCAGIIAGIGNNGIGIAGTCPECKIRCVRFLDDTAVVPVSADVDAMRFALDHADVAVVSNSWGYTQAIAVPAGLQAAIEDVSAHGHGGSGALVIFASGNNDRSLHQDELYALPEVLTVGAINNFDEVAPFSNYGADLDLVAPTGSLTLDLQGDAGASRDDYTSLFGGTSAACPVVAGVAALMFSAKPTATPTEIRNLLINSARPAPFAVNDSHGHDVHYGYGIVNPGQAMEQLLGLYDAGVDAGTSPDAGVDAGQPVTNSLISSTLTPVGPMGCGCTSTNGSIVFLAGALLLISRRARR